MPRLARRLLFPILILVIAGVITLLSDRTRTSQRVAVEIFAQRFVAGGPVGATESFIANQIAERLPRGKVLTFEVRDGDGGPNPDGSASHVVMVKADGLATLGLRCRYDSDPERMAFVGLFEPGATPPRAQQAE